MWEFVKIVGLGIASSIIYGILHDQVTARICIEYFTVFHPPVFATQSPFWLAVGWGVIATWWVGMILGLFVAAFARFGRAPKLSAREMVKPFVMLMIATGFASLIAGVSGYWLTRSGTVSISPTRLGMPLISTVVVENATGDPAMSARFVADLFAHNAAYATGMVGSVVIWGWCVRRRSLKKRVPV